MKRHYVLCICIVAAMVTPVVGNADVIFSTSAVVGAVDRTATFDSLTSNGIDLSAYSEDSLSVTVNDTSFQGIGIFNPNDPRTTAYHYANAGNSSFVSISATDGSAFSAIDFLMTDGGGPDTTHIRWETYLGGALTDSGTQLGVEKGIVVGWADSDGFDELRVAAGSTVIPPGFGNHQSIGLDDLRAELATVPEPSSYFFLAVVGVSMLVRNRRRQKVQS